VAEVDAQVLEQAVAANGQGMMSVLRAHKWAEMKAPSKARMFDWIMDKSDRFPYS
jgi:hypothetical protein